MEKKLYRIKEGEKLAGVCTGFAKYFNIDVTIVRLIWAAWVLLGGSGILGYIVAALIMPEEPRKDDYVEVNEN